MAIATSASGARIVAQSGNIPSEFSEAPTLASQVEAGNLPPVAERLPANPMVVEPHERIGQYGGTWNTALVGGQDGSWFLRTIAYEYLLRWDPDWEELIPNLAVSYEASADAREFTFQLREGVKWSDGAPFTADDILFYQEDVYANEALTSSAGPNPHTVEKIDDYAFMITFEQPNGQFLQEMAGARASEWTSYPRHYLEEFHENYNTETLDQLVEEAGAADWIELFRTKGASIPGTPYDARWSNPELPVLHGWRIVQPYGEGTRVVATRNPYYWKVDPDGNQLPYIDEVVYEVFEEPEVLLLRASNGDIDIHARHINTNTNKPVLAENQQSGGYHFFDIVPADMNTAAIALNLTHKNPVMREIFQNKDFRIGLSHAINRQEIIDVVYVSQGEFWQLAPRKETPFFNEILAKQYTDYDVDLANELLDGVLPEKDDEGFRLRPDGERLAIVIEVASSGVTAPVDTMNLVVNYWKEVGVNAQLQPEDRSLFSTRTDANEHDCAVWSGDGGLRDALLDPRWYVPFSDESNYGIGWYVWYAQPADAQTEAVEPPDDVKAHLEIWDQFKQTAGEDERIALFQELLATAQEQFYAMGISLPVPGYGIVKNNVVNVPESMPGSNTSNYGTPAPTNPEQYFFADTDAN